jgi:hypothetical protein
MTAIIDSPPSSARSRIIHLHIPKTAGTAFKQAFRQNFGSSSRIFPHWNETDYSAIDPEKYDFFSGHFGFKTASRIGGNIVSVFRNPVDRFLSVYFFWRERFLSGVEVGQHTSLAAKYSLDDFVTIRDEPLLLTQFYNRMTWQVAYGHMPHHRQELRALGKTEDEIFQMALQNLSTFSVVGVQERLGEFERMLRSRLDLNLQIARINVTRERGMLTEINIKTLARMSHTDE